jgi:hypothetical protein
VTTINNTPVWFGNEQIKPMAWDTVVRAFSFNPAQIAEKKDILWSEKKKSVMYKDMRDDVSSLIKGFISLPPEKRTVDQWAPIVERITEYNQRVVARKQVGIEPILDSKWVHKIIVLNSKPQKKEIRKDIARHQATGQPM